MKTYYLDDEEINLEELKRDMLFRKIMEKLDKLIELVKIRQKNRLKYYNKTHNIIQKGVKNSDKIDKNETFWQWFYSVK